MRGFFNPPIFYLWKSIERCPRPVINTWQQHYLNILLTKVTSFVPLYNDLYGDTENNRLTDLPVITKDYFRSVEMSERIFRPLLKKGSEWRSTSGSTGIPLTFPITSFYNKNYPDKRFLSYARYRFLSWTDHSIFTSNLSLVKQQRLCHIGIVPYETSPQSYLFIPIDKVRVDPMGVLREIEAFKPTFLETLPSVAAELVHQKTVEIFNIKIIHLIGERLTNPVRNSIEKTFAGTVFSAYGLEEIGMVGLECSEHDGFHISEESYIVEILDQYDQPVKDSTEGKIVITSLYGYAHPFIRYDTGDIGHIMKSKCACGLRTKRLIVKGRKGGMVEINGIRYLHMELVHAVEAIGEDILCFQWQLSNGSFPRLILSLAKNTTKKSDVATKIIGEIYNTLSLTLPNEHVSFVVTDFIRQNGKIPAIIHV